MAWNTNVFAGADLGPVQAQGDVTAAYGSQSGAGSAVSDHPLAPTQSFGMTFWAGVGGVVALYLLYRALPS